ncbi:MAG: shikimate dehydrogenase [Acidimicrobiia bacterium]
MTPGGATRVAAVIGDPVSHSRSPAIFNAAFAARELDWVYVAFTVRRGEAARALDGVRALDIAGLSVTMPHKADVAAACDELSPAAAVLDAVNVVVARDRRLFGDSTDGEGLVRSLRDEGVDPAGRRVLVLGAGGAARSIVHALGAHGAAVTVAARRPEAAASAAALAPGAVAAVLMDATADATDVGALVAASEVVVNATPLGMQGERPPFSADAIAGCRLVLDTVYHPAETPLLAEARARGVACANGLGMLVHQAGLAFEAFTGVPAPLEVMRAAAVGASGT